ncbi:hypothetical protein TRIUR3_01576 [Triticum urartu]|uniref:Uncharacterized protein n=1 Tax=Triticum urartu TaxID=4572 RepID=M7Z9U4_TRIUA|nr:hypothetical protein TRIUR3_01576 [Triticum urartu]
MATVFHVNNTCGDCIQTVNCGPPPQGDAGRVLCPTRRFALNILLLLAFFFFGIDTSTSPPPQPQVQIVIQVPDGGGFQAGFAAGVAAVPTCGLM